MIDMKHKFISIATFRLFPYIERLRKQYFVGNKQHIAYVKKLTVHPKGMHLNRVQHEPILEHHAELVSTFQRRVNLQRYYITIPFTYQLRFAAVNLERIFPQILQPVRFANVVALVHVF